MGKRKTRRVKRTVRVSCDHLVYEDEDGVEFTPRVGQWVDVRKKTSGQDYATMLELAAIGEEEGDAVVDEMLAALPALNQLIAHKVTAWNWIDLYGNEDEAGDLPLLPLPTLETIESLDFETDILHLIGLINELDETPKNELAPS